MRAVSPGGLIDPTPASITFDARTIAPTTTIDFVSDEDDSLCPDCSFQWMGTDLDGQVMSYEWALVSSFDYEADVGQPLPVDLDEAADSVRTWLASDAGLWESTPEVFHDFAGLAETTGADSLNRWWFAVRAIDDANATETILEAGRNLVTFDVYDVVGSGGPLISIQAYRANDTPIADADWSTAEPENDFTLPSAITSVRFGVTAQPATPCSEVDTYEYKYDSGAFAPLVLFDENGAPQHFPKPPAVWAPGSGHHEFTVRVTDTQGRSRELIAMLNFP